MAAFPEAAARRAREFVAAGGRAVPARQASTVVLVRDGDRGLEVYVQIRQPSMPFAGGMVAFPGGGVDDDDVRAALADAGAWASRLATDDTSARAFVNAALRETHEETGLTLRAADLQPWAHWVTPRFEPRRYDTWFFLAALPAGADAADRSGEASAVMWVRPDDAADLVARDEWVMLPPTIAVLAELAACGSVADALARAESRVVPTVLPGWVDDGDRVWPLLPDDPRYPGDDPGEGS